MPDVSGSPLSRSAMDAGTEQHRLQEFRRWIIPDQVPLLTFLFVFADR